MEVNEYKVTRVPINEAKLRSICDADHLCLPIA